MKKYGNSTSLCTYGHSHRSKLESAVCGIISLREQAKELELIQVEDHIQICCKEESCKAKISYVADFKCLDLKSGEVFWIEAKGYADHVWPLKKRLWKHHGPGKLEIWVGNYRKPYLDEII